MTHNKKHYTLYALIIGLLLTFSHTAQAQDVPDGFDPNANGIVRSIAVQPDGKILIGGAFTTLRGGTVTRNRIARLGFAPSAASVSVAGRLSVGKGSGLANAFVNLTDQDGNTRTVQTSSFGYYRFDDVEVGQTYTVTIRSRRYFFSPQIVSVNEEIEDLNFTAN